MADVDLNKIEAFATLEEEKGDIIQSDEDRKEILDYVTSELGKILDGTERKTMLDNVSKWRRQREVRPDEEEKSFPWPGASNLTVPMALTSTNGIYSMLKASFVQRKPFWTVTAKDDKKVRKAEAWGHFLDALTESRYHMNLRQANKTILYDLASLGTQFVKVPWILDQYNFKRRGPGGSYESVTKIRKNCPGIVPIRFEDFLCRSFYSDINRAPLVGHRVALLAHELRQREAQGKYRGVEQVLSRTADGLTEDRKEELSRIGLDSQADAESGIYNLYELHHFFDVDGDGVEEDITLWVDLPTQTILRSSFNELGVRDLIRIPYFERPYQLYGMGVGWISEGMQDEADTLHNARVNANLLSTLQMYITRRGAMAPNERFRPLKNIVVDNPKEDFLPIKFPDISSGSLQSELLAKEYNDRAVGTADAMMGFENRASSSRTTMGGTMFLADQAAKVFTYAGQESVVDAYNEIGMLYTFQLINNRERSKQLLYLVDEKYHPYIIEVLDTPIEDIPTIFDLQIKTTEIDKSEDSKRKNMITMVQLYTMYGQQIFQLLPQIYDPRLQVPDEIKIVAQKFVIGATTMIEEILKGLGVNDVYNYLPFIEDLKMITQAIEGMKMQQLGQITGRGLEGGEGGREQ